VPVANLINCGIRHWQARVRRKGYPPVMRTFETKTDANRWTGAAAVLRFLSYVSYNDTYHP